MFAEGETPQRPTPNDPRAGASWLDADSSTMIDNVSCLPLLGASRRDANAPARGDATTVAQRLIPLGLPGPP
jgi:hypothetical protein